MTESEYTYTDSFKVTDNIKQAFDDNGYVMIRKMFDEEEICQMKKVLEDSDMAQKYGYGLPDGQGKQAGLVIWSHPGDDVTGIVSRSEKVVDTCQELLGGGEIYHYHAKFVRKDAYTGGSFLWHQDYGYWYKNGNLFPDLLTIFIPVDISDQTNGCLQDKKMLTKILFVVSIFVAAVYGATKIDGVEGDVLTLECNPGTSIDIKSAFYGNNVDPACGDASALTTLQALTSGKQTYVVTLNSDTFSSDCSVDREQTFTVKFNCISNLLTQTENQGDTATLSCSNGEKIKIINAEYKSGSSCLDLNALSIVQGLCDDESSCSVAATDTVFPDSDCAANEEETLSISYKCTSATGPVYTRYGASGCSVTAAVVYKGTMAGAKHDGSGSGSNYQCLTSSPTYDVTNANVNSERGYIYGMELKLDTTDSTSVIDVSNDESTIPCTVCQVISSKSVFMVAGLLTCPSGYAAEYTGYLASDSTDGTTSKSYICLDKDASYAGATSNNQGLLYLTEIKCGSLSCSTFTDNADIPCAVCSRAVTSS